MTDSRYQIETHPLTPDRWSDLETLFGARGAMGGCWCMWFRLTARDYENSKGEINRAMFKSVVDSGRQPGILAYLDSFPVGWCAVAPRNEYPRYETSRIARRVDELPVWVISCLFIGKNHRRQGIMTVLIDAAVAHAFRLGATIVEAYPIDTHGKAGTDSFLYHGTLTAFQRAGFDEVARRAPNRPVMRRVHSH